MIVARLWLVVMATCSFLVAPPALADGRPAVAQKLSTLSTKCDAGKAAACLELGTIRENDQDDDVRSFELAAKAYKSACDLSQFAACNRLGDLYYFGRGVPRNTAISFELYKRACATDIAEACFSQGRILSGGDGGAAESAALYKKACADGYLDACTYEADSWFSGDAGTQDAARGEAILNASCARGAESSCVALADRLFWGNPMPKDPARAQALLDGNCSAKGVKSCMRMAGALQNGYDLPKDQARAVLSLEKACKLKSAEGCDRFARALHNGVGIAPNKARALTLFDWACTQESRYCESGMLIRKEPGLSKACDDGTMASCIELAQVASGTYSVLANTSRALSLYARACDGDVATSCSAAANMLSLQGASNDPTVKPSILAYRERGCAGGDAQACASLALSYQYGEGGQSDEVKAATYFVRACTLGDTRACDDRDRLVGLAPDLAIESANADQRPPADEVAQSVQIAETAREDCRTETTVFEGRTFEQRNCTSPVIIGFDVEAGSAPWQALIERPASLGGQRLSGTSRVLCGGSLIEKGWILTAAHCLNDEGRDIGKGGYSIRLGLFDVTKPEGISYPILKVIPHKDFVPGRRSLANDIALIRYDARAPSRKGTLYAIKTIRLDDKPVGQRSILDGMSAYTYGWGWTEAVNSQANATLKGAKLALRTENDCSKITRFAGPLANVVLCAAGKNGDQACYGDSGGSLVYYGDSDKVPRVIGVVSAGKRCGTLSEPSRYTRVGRVVDWIRPIVWPSTRPSAR